MFRLNRVGQLHGSMGHVHFNIHLQMVVSCGLEGWFRCYMPYFCNYDFVTYGCAFDEIGSYVYIVNFGYVTSEIVEYLLVAHEDIMLVNIYYGCILFFVLV